MIDLNISNSIELQPHVDRPKSRDSHMTRNFKVNRAYPFYWFDREGLPSRELLRTNEKVHTIPYLFTTEDAPRLVDLYERNQNLASIESHTAHIRGEM